MTKSYNKINNKISKIHNKISKIKLLKLLFKKQELSENYQRNEQTCLGETRNRHFSTATLLDRWKGETKKIVARTEAEIVDSSVLKISPMKEGVKAKLRAYEVERERECVSWCWFTKVKAEELIRAIFNLMFNLSEVFFLNAC